jgi:dephospho-CoA kinase
VHPLVAEARARFLRAADSPVFVLDVPLLFERGIDAECDGVAVVSAPEATQTARLLARPGWMRRRRRCCWAGRCEMPRSERGRRG